MSEIVASGNIVLVDLNDTKQLQMFLCSSQPKTQIFDVNNEKYSPDWEVNNPILTPQLFVAGSGENIINNIKSIKWYEEEREIINRDDYGITGNTLTIKRNVLSKNLIPSFSSGFWLTDETNGGGTFTVDDSNPYRATLTLTGASQARVVHVPVEDGKTYTLSYGSETTGLSRLYKGKLTKFIDTGIYSQSKFVTFTVDSTFEGYVTIRITNGVTGTFTFENPQLEEGSVQTSFSEQISLNSIRQLSCEVIYTDPDTGFDIVSEASIDLSLIQTGSKGDKGQVGDNAIVAVLNNDYQTIYTDKDGNNGNYSGAVSTITIYSGSKDDTSNWSISASTSNVTGVLSGNTYTVTNLTADTGYVIFTATRSGYTTITKQFRLSKSKIGSTGNTGSTGSSATEYWLVTDANVLQRNSSSYHPVSITVSGKYQYGSGTPTAYAGRFVISESYDGTSYSVVSSSTTNEWTRVYTPSNQTIKIIKVQLYLAGGTTTLLDEQTIPIVEDGTSGQSGDNAKNLVVWTPEGDTIKNGENKVVAQADLYDGSTLIEGDNYRWYRENPNATSEGGVGWESLDNGKRNLFSRVNGRSGYYDNGGNFVNGGNTYSTPFIDVSVSKELIIHQTEGFNYFRIAQFDIDKKFISRILISNENPYKYTASADVKYIVVGADNNANSLKVEYGNTLTPYQPAPEDMKIDENDSNMYGRNLLLGMEGMSGVHTYRNGASNEYGILQSDGFYRYSLNPSGGKIAEILADKFYDVVVGKTYTKSLLYKTDSTDLSFGFTFFTNEHHPRSVTTINMGNGVKKVYATWVADYPRLRAPDINEFSFTNGTYIDIKDVKLEEGSVLTDWTPAPEDNSDLYPTVANGLNSWIFEKYDNTGVTSIQVVGYDDIKKLTPTYKSILKDMSNLVYNLGDYYIGYIRTSVYASQDKVVNMSLTIDDSINAYINGVSVYSITSATRQSFDLKLRKGWNSVEFIGYERAGGDLFFNITTLLSAQVDEMNCYYALPYGQLRGIDGVEGYNTKSITVSKDAVINVENFKCVVERGGKNILHTDVNAWENGTYSNNGVGSVPTKGIRTDRIRSASFMFIKPNTTYIFSASSGYGICFIELDKEDKIIIDHGWVTGKTITTTSNTTKFYALSRRENGEPIDYTEVYNANLQIEEGTSITSFEEHGVYEDQITIQDVTDPYAVTIIGANTFKNGEGQNTFTAKVFQNGTEVDVDGNQFTYKWYLYNQDDIVDTTWNGVGYKEGKTITINATDVAYQGRVICEVDG